MGVEPPNDDDLTQLKHVRSRTEIKAAEEIARRQPCVDFDQFRSVFDKVQQELDNGLRITERCQADARVKLGDEFVDAHGNRDRRIRAIYNNGTESNLLLLSLKKALWRAPAGRRIGLPMRVLESLKTSSIAFLHRPELM